MKTKLLLFFIAFSGLAAAQDKKVYLDSTYLPTDEGNHVYYRIIKNYYKSQSTYNILQYYKTGELESEQTSTVKDFIKNKGTAVSYYTNGNKKCVINYDDKGYREGECLFWYETGKPKFEGSFVKTIQKKNGFDITESKLKITNFWNTENKQTASNGSGEYTDDGFFDYLSNTSVSTGSIIDGYKDGVWSGRDDKRGITFTETYSSGKIISGKSIDKSGNEYTYEEAFVVAAAKGGITQFYKFIGRNFITPSNVTGQVTIITRFVVKSNDEIGKMENIKSGGKAADAEAFRVILAFNGFTAAKYRGITIDSEFTLPITIQSSE